MANRDVKSEENGGEWTIVNEGDRTFRRRVHTIPAPAEGQDPIPKSSSDQLNDKKIRPISKQQRMLRQIKAQKELENEQKSVIESYTSGAFQQQIVKYLKTIWILLSIGGLLLYLYAPEIVNKWLFSRKPVLVDRALMTVYPMDVRIRQDLPLFFHTYAVATPENEPSRRAVKHAAHLRSLVKDAGTFKQKISFHAWEHADFSRQMMYANVSMDGYCGDGFREGYRGASSPNMKDDLLIWCFLARGQNDGFVKYHVKTIRSGITRGRKGVALQYINEKRIHTDSLLLLPIQSLDDVKQAKAKKIRLEPSTVVGYRALEWLRANAGLAKEVYTKLFEEYLYRQIESERERWEIWNIACSKEGRQHAQTTQRLTGTTCKEHDSDERDSEEEECCSFYDPALKPRPSSEQRS